MSVFAGMNITEALSSQEMQIVSIQGNGETTLMVHNVEKAPSMVVCFSIRLTNTPNNSIISSIGIDGAEFSQVVRKSSSGIVGVYFQSGGFVYEPASKTIYISGYSTNRFNSDTPYIICYI